MSFLLQQFHSMTTESVPVDPSPSALKEDVSPRFVTRTVWYKKVEYPEIDSSPFSLEEKIRKALAKTPHWKDRQQRLREQPPEVLVYNEHKLLDAGVTGRLALYEKDAAVEIGTLDEDTPTISSEFLLPSGAKSQVCSGTLHFLIRGNHVVLVPSRSVKWNMLANFFNAWLFEDLSLMPAGFRIALVDVIPQRAHAELSRVRRVEIRTALTADTLDWESEEEGIQLGFRGVLAETTKAMAKEVFGAGTPPISVRDAVNESPLHAKLILERKGRRIDDDMLLRQIALAVRGQEDVPFVIRYGKRGKLTNKDVSVSDQIILPAKHGHPQFASTTRKLLEWFDEGLESGEIPAAEE